MHRRILVVTGLLGALSWGCGQSDPIPPTLRITPSGDSGAVQVTQPTAFNAELVNSSSPVTWSLTGAGTLSGTAGMHVVYAPPPGTATAKLTATAGLLTASVDISAAPPASTVAIPNLSAKVTVQYDAQDIPHITCAKTTDCLAVQGYLHARDRLFMMDFLRRVARGHLAELIGLAGLEQDIQLRTLFTTRSGGRLEKELALALDPNTRALLEAYAGGVNAYLAELRKPMGPALPAEYKQLPFPITGAEIGPWEVEDTLAIGRLQSFQLSETIEEESGFGAFAAFYSDPDHLDLGKINAWIRAPAPLTEQAHTLSELPFHPPAPSVSASARTAKAATSALSATDLSAWKTVLGKVNAGAAALRESLRPAGTAVGSNNWVVSKDKSTSHMAMVANDPHLSLQYPPLFHLSVMTSTNAADNLNLAGGAFPGIPGSLVGRGANVGWGVTVVGYDVTDLYAEQFVPQASCPGGEAGGIPCVLFKGVPTSTHPVEVKFMVRVGPGASLVDAVADLHIPDVPPVVLIVPHHGPIIEAPDKDGHAVSVRWTGHESNTQDTKAFNGLNIATDVDAAVEALKGFATGAQNFVLADDKGHIAYDPHALVPVRAFATVAHADHPPWMPLPNDGNFEWGDGTHDCAAAAGVADECWISALPFGKDPAKGYYFTANADPRASLAPEVPDTDDPLTRQPYLSFRWSDTTGFRATRIDQMLNEAITGHGGVSLADMQAIQGDHVSRPGMFFTGYIDAKLPTSAGSPPALIAAKAVLAQWAANGWDCPTGLVGSDPRTSAADTTPKVVQNSAGCYLFHVFLRTLIKNVFTDDLAFAGLGVDGLSAIIAMTYMLDENTPETDTTFCKNVNAAGAIVSAPSCGEQVATALVQAYSALASQVGPNPSDWVWGRVHTIQPVSLLALVTTNFSPGPYARPGGAFTVDVGNPRSSSSILDFGYTSGGNVRHVSVMDPAKPVVKMQLPGPERDGPATFAGPDLLGQWVNNTYFDFAFGDQIGNVTVSNQTFNPATP